MSGSLKRSHSGEIKEELHYDEDSDVGAQSDDEDMKGDIFDMHQSFELYGYFEVKKEEFLDPMECVQLTAQPEPMTERAEVSTSSQINYRKKDEANGWTYVAREQLPEQPVFQSQSGVRTPVNLITSPYECLLQYFTTNFWNLLKTETNRYASQMKTLHSRKGLLKNHSLLALWKPVTINELKMFFSIIIHMTLVRKESMDAYWSTKSILHNDFPCKIMRRDRFRAIYSCLHLNDNSHHVPRGNDNYDPLFKLRPYFDELCRLYENLYMPDENLTIDEGRVHIKDLNSVNPDKQNGVKIYMLCDSEVGYVLRMVPYVEGAKTVKQPLMELLQPYFGKWHTVYMDNFFTSPSIADLLWINKTRIVGTVMSNRTDLPSEWRQQPLETNEMAFCHRENLTACKWKDKRYVSILTTKHAATWTRVDIKVKARKIKKVKPDCVLDYNINNNSMGRYNYLASYYSLNRKSAKWWKKTFFCLIARTMVNAYIVYNKSRPGMKKLGFANFLASCGESMAKDAGVIEKVKTSPGPRAAGSATRLFGRHFLKRIPPTDKKKSRCRVCKVCADTIKKATGKRGRKETVYYCPDCNIPLCVIPCFEKYHTKKDYTL